MMSLEQLQAILGSSDVSEMEEQRKNYFGLGTGAQAGMAQTQRGRGGNLGRALYGVASGLGAYKGLSASPGITEGKKDLYAKLLRSLTQQQGRTGPQVTQGRGPQEDIPPLMQE